MAGCPRRKRGRLHPSAVFAAATALWLLSVASQPSVSCAFRPSTHGLAFQKNATENESRMATFFRGGPTIPVAGNGSAAPVWDVPAGTSANDGDAAAAEVVDGRDRARTVLLTAGVVCGAVGVALLAAAAFAYLIRARRRRREACSRVGGGGGGT